MERIMANTAPKRPSHDERRRLILEAAADIFFEQGYSAASIDLIIQRVGGSKRTIYAEFGSKEGLFTALVMQNADRALHALSADEVSGRDLRETLLILGRELTTLYMSNSLIGTYRAIIAEGHRVPELARAFYDKGPGRSIDLLTGLFEESHRRGEVHIENCAMAANHFLAMIRDNIHLEVLLGLRPPPTAAESEAAVAAAVDMFWNGVRPR